MSIIGRPGTARREKQLAIWLLAAMALLLAVRTAESQVEDSLPELPNFHRVNEHLYRGGQPRSGGLQRLAAMGIKTILNLRKDGEPVREEEAQAQSLGMHYFSVPMAGLSRPSDAQVESALAIINSPANWPVFVHCKHGRDRTGTIIACYRISHDNWTSSEAKAEAKKYGMSPFEHGMKSYISDYYKRRRESQSGRVASREFESPEVRLLDECPPDDFSALLYR